MVELVAAHRNYSNGNRCDHPWPTKERALPDAGVIGDSAGGYRGPRRENSVDADERHQVREPSALTPAVFRI